MSQARMRYTSISYNGSHTYLFVIPAAFWHPIELRAVADELLPSEGFEGCRASGQYLAGFGLVR